MRKVKKCQIHFFILLYILTSFRYTHLKYQQKANHLKKNLIQFLLLFSLFFNIAHATVIALEDDCHHESSHDYMQEQSTSTECGDLCDMHHLFHFMAVISTQSLNFHHDVPSTQATHTTSLYSQDTYKKDIKPPIS